MKSDGLMTYLSKCKKRPLIVILALLGLACLLLGGLGVGGARGESGREEDADGVYLSRLTRELTELLSQVEGVGSPEVLVTLARGERVSYSSGKVSASEPPLVLGVAVVCRGGGRAEVRAEVTSLLSALLGIGTHRIHVSEKSS